MDPKIADENLGPALVAVAWTFAAIAIVVVSVRFYVRLRIVQTLTVDDYLIILVLLLALGNSIFCTLSVHWRLGRHIQFLTSEQVTKSIKWIYICEFFTIMSPSFGRISFAFLLLGIIAPTKWRRRYLWTIITIQFVVDIITVIITYMQCKPITGFWDATVKADCWPREVQERTGYFQGSICSLVDLLLAVFPASLFWNLRMPLKMKISLSILMGLGVFAMIASIGKTIQLRQISKKGDATHAMAILAIWFTFEAYLVLIAASIPTLRHLIHSTTSQRQRTKKNYWPTSQSRSGASKKPKDKGTFISLDEPTSLENIIAKPSASHVVDAHPTEGIDSLNSTKN